MPRGRWMIGVLVELAGLGLIAGGVTQAVAATHRHVATAAELWVYDGRLTRGVLLVAGGVFMCMASGQIRRAAPCWRRLSRLGRVLFVGGYLLAATGLAVITQHASVRSFYVGFGLQVIGAVAVGIGGNTARPDLDPPSPHGCSGH